MALPLIAGGIVIAGEAGAFGEAIAVTTGLVVGVGEFLGELGLVVGSTTILEESAIVAARAAGGASARLAVAGAVGGVINEGIHQGKVVVDIAGNFLSMADAQEPLSESPGIETRKRKRGDNPKSPHKRIVTVAEFLRIHKRNHPLLASSLDMTGKRHSNGIPYTRTVVQRFSTNEGTMNQPGNDTTVGLWILANAIENPFQDAAIVSNALLFDQMVAIYEKYYVKKATLRVDFFNDSTTEGQVVGLSLKDDVTILSSTGQYVENGETVYRTLTPKEHTQLVMAVKPPAFFGSKTPSSDSRLQVIATGGDAADARPTDALYYHLWTAPMDGVNTVTTTSVKCFITIEYEVVWSQPRDMARGVAT